MTLGIKNSIPFIPIKKRNFINCCLVFLCAVLIGTGIKSCKERKYKLSEHVLDKISVEFEPFITDIYLKMPPGSNLNTKLIYSVYINEFDNGKTVNLDTAERLTSCFYTSRNSKIIPIDEINSIFENIEKVFNIKIKNEKREEIISFSKDLPPGYIDSIQVLKKGLVSINGQKTNIGLVNFAWNALSCKSGYVFGGYGQDICTEFLLKQQKKFKNNERAELGKEQIEFIFKISEADQAFDCGGLIKAYSWFDEEMGEIILNRENGIKDCTANGLYDKAEVKGGISNMPDIPGLAVHKNGHVGIYIGGGEVIEAKGNKFGVVKTELNSKGWEHYFKVPKIKYINSGTFKIGSKEVTLYNEKIVNKNEF